MKFLIEPRSGVPIYKQLMQQIDKGVSAGLLQPGDRMPTVREVALELTINPNTVARAYRELEARGILESMQGRGTFIAETLAPPAPGELEERLREEIRKLLKEVEQLGMDPAWMGELFSEVLEEWKKE